MMSASEVINPDCLSSKAPETATEEEPPLRIKCPVLVVMLPSEIVVSAVVPDLF
jgi:hypothetical protein